MSLRGGIRRWCQVAGLGLLALPAPASAQLSPTITPHPALPWALGIATPHGQLLRYIYVPPQPIMLEYVVPGVPPPPAEPETAPAEGERPPAEQTPPQEPVAPVAPPPQILRQQIAIPGYYVRETTVGFHYPERWMIEPAGFNVYRWRQIPPQFVPK